MKRDKLLRLTAICLAFYGCVLAACLYGYTVFIQHQMANQIGHALEDVAAQSCLVLRQEVEAKQQLLQGVAQQIVSAGADQPEAGVRSLMPLVKMYGFKRMGIATADGTAFTTDSRVIQVGQRDFFLVAMENEKVLTAPVKDSTDGMWVNVYAVPLVENQEPVGVLFAVYSTRQFRTLLDVPSFQGKGYSYVIESDGTIVVSRNNIDENLFQMLPAVSERNLQAVEVMQKDMARGGSGMVEFERDGRRYGYYMLLGINDWYLLNVVPSEVLEARTAPVLGANHLLIGILVVSFLAGAAVLSGTRARQKRRLMELAYADPLTGGYNFAKFCQEADEQLKQPHGKLACVVLDLQNFKRINSIFGVEEGNRVLRQVWSVWLSSIRTGEVAARRTADHFVALWKYDDPAQLETRAEEVAQVLLDVSQDANRPNVMPAIGVYELEEKDFEWEKVYNQALTASKMVRTRQGFCAFYDQAMRDATRELQQIESRLDGAFLNREFIPYYQPKFGPDGTTVTGAEALVRWNCDGTLLPPGRFIPLCEQNGWISRLDDYMLEAVVRQQTAWRKQGRAIVPVSVNLSRARLYQKDYAIRCREMFQQAGLPPWAVQFEVTESAAVENVENMRDVIRQLHQAGFRVLVDDFGTGYSSMASLKDLSFDILKLDKSFVDEIGNSRGDKIIRFTIELAKSLGMSVTAEGVEQEQQFLFLKERGCDDFQGYYFAKPLAAQAFEQLLRPEKEGEQ